MLINALMRCNFCHDKAINTGALAGSLNGRVDCEVAIGAYQTSLHSLADTTYYIPRGNGDIALRLWLIETTEMVTR